MNIAVGHNHILGFVSDGSVVAYDENFSGQCDIGDWGNITQIEIYNSITFCVKKEGKMLIAGRLAEKYWGTPLISPKPKFVQK
jgi:hypothetical protein